MPPTSIRSDLGSIKAYRVDDGVLTIPGEFTKNGRAHAIPLQPMALSILAAQPTKGTYYFPDRWDGDSHFNDGLWGKFKKELNERSA